MFKIFIGVLCAKECALTRAETPNCRVTAGVGNPDHAARVRVPDIVSQSLSGHAAAGSPQDPSSFVNCIQVPPPPSLQKSRVLFIFPRETPISSCRACTALNPGPCFCSRVCFCSVFPSVSVPGARCAGFLLYVSGCSVLVSVWPPNVPVGILSSILPCKCKIPAAGSPDLKGRDGKAGVERSPG